MDQKYSELINILQNASVVDPALKSLPPERPDLVSAVNEYYQLLLNKIAYLFNTIKVLDESGDDFIMEYADQQLQEQLVLFWIDMQTEWIRYNDLATISASVLQNEDHLVQSKASICSQFLEPIGKLIDVAILREKIDYIASLHDRATFGSVQK